MKAICYDSKCNLCSAIVYSLRKKARLKNIELIDVKDFPDEKHTLPANLSGKDTILFINQDTAYFYSDAVIQLFIQLGVMYSIFGRLLSMVPKSIRDKLYRFIAGNRYRIFGSSTCSCS
ncbi:MAG: DUF393 domain-containing protein [Bacteroidales bacterium]|nr:DUF393 domain-containing protein [Bacteroidales bacterium]